MTRSAMLDNVVGLSAEFSPQDFLPAYLEAMVEKNPQAPEELTNILVETLSRLTGVATGGKAQDQPAPHSAPRPAPRTPQQAPRAPSRTPRSSRPASATPRRTPRSARPPQQATYYQSPYMEDHEDRAAPLSPLAQVYRSFSSFGNRGGEDGLMDGARFAKLTRDCQILTKNFTSTDIDIIFAKVKGKTERKIDYEQFQLALLMIAERRHPDLDPEQAFEHVLDLVLQGGPTIRCTKIDNSYIVDKMTDVTLYTGSHRERFDMETGQGLGIVNKHEFMSSWDAIPQEHYQ